MKFNCGPSRQEQWDAALARREARIAELKRWHRIFAIWPRRVGKGDCRAFEWVWRLALQVESNSFHPESFRVVMWEYATSLPPSLGSAPGPNPPPRKP